MGANVEQEGGYVCADAPTEGLGGGHVYLDIVSRRRDDEHSARGGAVRRDDRH